MHTQNILPYAGTNISYSCRHKNISSYAHTKISYLMQTHKYIILCRQKHILSYADTIPYLMQTQKYIILCRYKNILTYADIKITYLINTNTKISYIVNTQEYLILYMNKCILCTHKYSHKCMQMQVYENFVFRKAFPENLLPLQIVFAPYT